MAKTMPKVTPQDTGDHFIGSGALSWEWWRVVEMHGIDHPDNADDWRVVVEECYDGVLTGKRVTFDHASVMRAVRLIAAGKAKGIDRDSVTGRECQALIFKGADATDFDASSADSVLQVAAFGEVIYG
jgi:hypothetical protein